MTVHINARFLTQPVSGVQRFARGLLGALDARLVNDPGLNRQFGPFDAWYPAGQTLIAPPDWQAIRLRPLRGGTGHMWEQVRLGAQVGTAPLLSLCGSGPLICDRQLLVLHDANIWTEPAAFSWRYTLFHRAMRPLLATRAGQLATVSRHAAASLSDHLRISRDRFTIIANSAEHILHVEEDRQALQQFGLTPGGYILTVGNRSPNKNISRLAAAVLRLPGQAPVLAVAGGNVPGVRVDGQNGCDRIRLLGRVTDGALKALYRNAACFVWPALSEGFGIPPLEAMAAGTPVLSSNRTAMPDVLGDAAWYFDPEDVASMTQCLRQFLALPAGARADMAGRGKRQAARYSWDTGAGLLLESLAAMTLPQDLPFAADGLDASHAPRAS